MKAQKKRRKRRRRRRNRERGGGRENEGRGSSLCLGSGRQNKNLKKINIRKQQAGKNEETNERKEATVSRVEKETGEKEGGRECEGEQVESRKLSQPCEARWQLKSGHVTKQKKK